ncbi:MAG: hypothetical protein H0U54_18340 [Acidobacteria bacterium]|jgi:hypothetical protein|nr:hypothetical protein [Acidobacteriota bacterium]
MAKQRIVAYAADTMDSLATLERTCERDEARLTSKLVSLQLASIDTVDGKKVTAATYERTDEMRVGHLIFEEFTTENDVDVRTAIHKTKTEPFVCKGQAFIKTDSKNVIVFREKQQ